MSREGEFIKVSYKKGRRKKMPTILSTSNEVSYLFDLKKAIGRITEAQQDLRESIFFQTILKYIANRTINDIICLGLGHVSEHYIPRYQFALLLCLKDSLSVPEIRAADPLFNRNDIDLLKHFEIDVDDRNLEGKYTVNSGTTLFFLPHCSKQLTNNLLWANWGSGLHRCILIANSFSEIYRDNSWEALSKSYSYICKIRPYKVEKQIENTFQPFDVFNSMSVHLFPVIEQMECFSKDAQEPQYCDCDVEYIQNSLKNCMKIE